MDEERMEGIKETTTEAQSPLNPSLAMMVGCGVGTASYSTAPFQTSHIYTRAETQLPTSQRLRVWVGGVCVSVCVC